MRQSDEEAVRRARLYVDAREGALKSGDIVQPIQAAVIREPDIVGDLFGLCRTTEEITLLKSVGTAATFAYSCLTATEAVQLS
jgi:ornithine cyclodeaminase